MIQVRVAAVRDECADGSARIRSFELRRPDGEPLPPFAAGAHVDVELPGGLVRQYSLCNAPGETHRYVVAVLHEPASRGGSRGMHALREGSELRIGQPRNLFPLQEGHSHSLLFAGGIGITPLLAMAEQLSSQGRPFGLHYCARSSGQAAFMGRLAQAPWAGCVHLYFDDGPRRLDVASALESAPAGAHLYVCGPAGFMAHVLEAGRHAGWAEQRLHREYFDAAAMAPVAGDVPFEVKIASSGETFVVPPGRSIAQVLDEAGVFVPVSCEQGICGTCLTTVLEGEPDHRDQFLSDQEHARNDCMTLCCSRARSPCLVLDL